MYGALAALVAVAGVVLGLPVLADYAETGIVARMPSLLVAAILGVLADRSGIETVYRLCAFLPAIGLLAAFLPKIDKHPPLAPTPPGLEPEAV